MEKLRFPTNLWAQVHRNLVAIISLFVALSGLFYNTWRNELTEHNRNVRSAGFQMILTIGELQQIVFFSHYDQDAERGSPRAGWSRVLLLDDLSGFMPPSVTLATDELLATWESEWSGLGQDDAAEQQITASIDRLRGETRKALADLE
jgi:hypothetical protein